MRCSMIIQLILASAMNSLFSVAYETSYEGYRVYRLHTSATEPHKELWQKLRQKGVDFLGRTDITVSPENLERLLQTLAELQVQHEETVHNLQDAIHEEKRRLENNVIDETPRYYRYVEMEVHLLELEKRYPEIISLQCIGESFEGRDLHLVKVSTGGDGTRPVILLEAGIHAREWLSPAMALYTIEQLLDASNVHLIAGVDWHVIPLINPDGYEYSHTHDRMWRKTRSVTAPCCKSNHTCTDDKQGVDGNRNFDIEWNTTGVSSDHCSPKYPGPHPFSEAETAAYRDYVLGIAKKIRLFVSLHSYGQYILYPRIYSGEPIQDNNITYNLASEANAAQKKVTNQSYNIDTTVSHQGPVSGNSVDWMKAKAGVELSYAIELPGGGGGWDFDFPVEELPKTLSGAWPIIETFGKHVVAKSR